MMQPPCSLSVSRDTPGLVSKRSRLSFQSLLLRCLFRRWSCGHNNSGHCFGGARSCTLLQMGCWDGLDAHLLTKKGGLISGLHSSSIRKSKQTSPSWSTVCIRPYLCSLTLLLKLLQLLGSEETHWLIASNELSTCWHGCEDDVATQPTETVKGKQKYDHITQTEATDCMKDNEKA